MTEILCDRGVPLRLNGIFYWIAIRPPLLYGLNCKALRNYCWNIRVAKKHVLKIDEQKYPK